MSIYMINMINNMTKNSAGSISVIFLHIAICKICNICNNITMAYSSHIVRARACAGVCSTCFAPHCCRSLEFAT